MCELANRPHALTWKEFRSIRAKWEADSKPAVLSDLIANHAVERAVSVDDVDNEIFQAMVGGRNNLLGEAGQQLSQPDYTQNPDSR